MCQSEPLIPKRSAKTREGEHETTADRPTPAPIACTLQSGDFQERLIWIAELNRDALRCRRRNGQRLELTYESAARDRVQELVAHEQDCCAFLTFHVEPKANSVHLVIEAPEEARDVLDAIFKPFLGGEPDSAAAVVDVEAP